MRVAQVIGKLSAAGVEAVVNNYFRYMDASSIQFDYLIDDDSVLSPPKEMIDAGARYLVIPASKKMLSRVRALFRIFRENKYDIVHAHMNTLNAPVLFAAWMAGTPVRISHNHSMAAGEEWKRTMLKWCLRPTAKWFATNYFACGEAAGRWMFGNRSFEAGRVVILPNAVDISKYQFDAQARKELRRSLALTEAVVLGHVGRFMPQKNHMFLLDIFQAFLRRCPEAVLLLIGDGELKSSMQEEVKRRGLYEHVRFLGVRMDVFQLYSVMDVFLLPSLYEGVPVVGIEAQASGLPCFFSNRVSREANISGNVSFLPLQAGGEAWAEAIAACVKARDPNRRTAAEKMRGSLFDLSCSGTQLQALYQQYMTEHARSTVTNPFNRRA